GKVEFVPGLVVLGKRDALPASGHFGFVVLVAPADELPEEHAEAIRFLVARDGLLVITCVDRDSLNALRRSPSPLPLSPEGRGEHFSPLAPRGRGEHSSPLAPGGRGVGVRGLLAEVVPDIVVFDESFVNHDVPFSAFTARKSLYGYWN